MSDYSQVTNFSAKDSLPTGDPDKKVLGSLFDTEFEALSSAISTKANKVASATADNMLLMTANGDLKDSGYNLESYFDAIYPVGSIYVNANNSTNPRTLMGFGTWERFGEGKVLVGLDSTDTDFDTAGETGGEKEHTLTKNEIPSHTHGSAGAHTHTVSTAIGIDGSTSGLATHSQGTSSSTRTTSTNGAHTHSSVGGDRPHNNLQPYVVVYMWKRTA